MVFINCLHIKINPKRLKAQRKRKPPLNSGDGVGQITYIICSDSFTNVNLITSTISLGFINWLNTVPYLTDISSLFFAAKIIYQIICMVTSRRTKQKCLDVVEFFICNHPLLYAFHLWLQDILGFTQQLMLKYCLITKNYVFLCLKKYSATRTIWYCKGQE